MEDSNIVFSTDPNYKNKNVSEDSKAKSQAAKIWLERRRGDKLVTIIKGLDKNSINLESLAKELKNKCAVGGTIKENIIQIQGNQRDKILTILQRKGIKAKKAGG